MDKTLTIDGILLGALSKEIHVLQHTSGMHATSFDRRTMKKGFLAIHVWNVSPRVLQQ